MAKKKSTSATKKTAAAKKTTTAKKVATKKAAKDADKKELAKLDETGNRESDTRRKNEEPVVKERRKTNRRRQIDPTTCERDYTDSEIEFMQALDDYKRASGRMFPTCSEILEVLGKLGYRKVDVTADGCCHHELPSCETKINETMDEVESQIDSVM